MHLTGLATLNKLYDETQQLTHRGANGGQFVSNALQVLDITLDVSTDALTRVPRTGPVVLVANHPFRRTRRSCPDGIDAATSP
jgi:putative hemolysin